MDVRRVCGQTRGAISLASPPEGGDHETPRSLPLIRCIDGAEAVNLMTGKTSGETVVEQETAEGHAGGAARRTCALPMQLGARPLRLPTRQAVWPAAP